MLLLLVPVVRCIAIILNLRICTITQQIRVWNRMRCIAIILNHKSCTVILLICVWNRRILKKYRDTWLILPNDYYDSEYIFYWVNDDESCEAMWNGTVLNDLVNGYDILLIADEEQHVRSWIFLFLKHMLFSKIKIFVYFCFVRTIIWFRHTYLTKLLRTSVEIEFFMQ
jgi:hypothetical protein